MHRILMLYSSDTTRWSTQAEIGRTRLPLLH